jgi:type II secretory pathway pseudopilin PulG
MGAFGAVIGGIAGAAAGGITSYVLTKKNAKAYEGYAKDIRKAAEDYSGQNAYNAMQNAGMQEANIVNQRNLAAQASRAPSNMTNKAANAANLQGNYSQGYNLGAQNQKTALDAAYNAKTAKAQQALNQANIDYKAGTAATQAAMNAAGGLASLYGQVKGMGSATPSESQTPSDERVKEYDNHSGLPKADVDDALRRIESINYKYKDGTGLDDKEHIGVTAQSVENTAFDGMVSENENGVKQLDKQMMLEAVLAGIASLRKELDDLENNKEDDKITSDENLKTTYRRKIMGR